MTREPTDGERRAYAQGYHEALIRERTWTIVLSRYQHDNLLWLLNVIGADPESRTPPFDMLATGDWVWEIAQKLNGDGTPDPDDRPNSTVAELRAQLADGGWARDGKAA